MRNTHLKRAVALTLAATLVAGMSLTGCGKKKVDYDMGDGEGGSDGGKLASKLEVPETYQGKLDGIDSGTGIQTVSLNVSNITVPDTDKMSVYYYESNTVDNEYKKRVCENFYDVSAGVYLYSWEKPYKEDIEREIELFQNKADQTTSDDEKSYYDEYMTTLKEQLKTATDEREGAGDYSGDTFVGTKGENMYMISFMSNDDGTNGGFYIDYYPGDLLINYRPKDDATYVYSYSSEYGYDDGTSQDSANMASISQEEAIQKGIEFLASCGISDIIETNVSDLLWEYSDTNYNTIATEKDGYVVTYKRSVDGVAPYTPSIYGIDTLNGSDDIWYDTQDESFELSIDSSGIVSAYCYDMFKATGDKEDNVKLLSWEDALKALPNAVNTYYTANKTNYSAIEFNDARLSYYKIKDGDRYKYTPVWAFAQCENGTDGTPDVDNPVQLIMMDAVTGELIDLTKVLTSESYEDTDDSDVMTDEEIIGDEDDIIVEDLGDDASDDVSDDSEVEMSDDSEAELADEETE